MAHAIVYPKGHPKQFTKKAAKDITPEERKTVEHQQSVYDHFKRFFAEKREQVRREDRQTLGQR